MLHFVLKKNYTAVCMVASLHYVQRPGCGSSHKQYAGSTDLGVDLQYICKIVLKIYQPKQKIHSSMLMMMVMRKNYYIYMW